MHQQIACAPTSSSNHHYRQNNAHTKSTASYGADAFHHQPNPPTPPAPRALHNLGTCKSGGGPLATFPQRSGLDRSNLWRAPARDQRAPGTFFCLCSRAPAHDHRRRRLRSALDMRATMLHNEPPNVAITIKPLNENARATTYQNTYVFFF